MDKQSFISDSTLFAWVSPHSVYITQSSIILHMQSWSFRDSWARTPPLHRLLHNSQLCAIYLRGVFISTQFTSSVTRGMFSHIPAFFSFFFQRITFSP